ncbi:MAG TPA: T9SS type A sorting domain-containing protein, partial [bacterium]
NGAMVVWEDWRSGNEFYEVANLYAQRMNDLSLSVPPIPRNDPLYPEPMLFAGPNPTNPLTVIRCLLPQPGFMELSIFDISGRLVEKLASGMHGAGVHSFTWNAKDKASGVYIVRLKTPLADKSTKLVMIK